MGTNLITTVVGFGLSTAFIVFVCVRLVCNRMRSVEVRAMAAVRAPTLFDLELQSEPDQSHHNVDGLEATVDIAALPMIKYSKGSFASNDESQCPICLGDYQEKEVLRIMPICCHHFHVNCVDEWLRRQLTCPICRLPIHDLVEDKYAAASLSTDALQTRVSPGVTDTRNRAYGDALAGNGSRGALETVHEHTVSVNADLSQSRCG